MPDIPAVLIAVLRAIACALSFGVVLVGSSDVGIREKRSSNAAVIEFWATNGCTMALGILIFLTMSGEQVGELIGGGFGLAGAFGGWLRGGCGVGGGGLGGGAGVVEGQEAAEEFLAGGGGDGVAGAVVLGRVSMEWKAWPFLCLSSDLWGA